MARREDVVVIGGGVIGVCAAYYLIQAGWQVTLLERAAVGSGCSYGNSGLIVPSHSVPLPVPGAVGRALRWMLDPDSPFYVRPRLDPKLISWLWQFRAACTEQRMRKGVSALLDLSTASIELYSELVSRERLDCNFTRSGLFVLYSTERGYEEGLEEAHLLREHGLTAREMAGNEVHDMEPGVRRDVAGGLYYEGDAYLNPAQFVEALAARVREQGGVIHEGAEVVGLESSGKEIATVSTPKEDYHPEQVVLAAGSWSPGVVRNTRIDLPVQPAKGYSLTYKSPGTALKFPLILGEAKVGVNPMGQEIRLAGTLELAGLDLTISSRRVSALVRAAGRYLVGDYESASFSDAWCGLRPVTPDGLPIIGAIESIPNLFVATGHAMMGMTMGPITGKMVAELICGQATTVDAGPVSPARFQ